MDYATLALQQHAKYKWKLAIHSKVPLENKDDLSTYYTPGVAKPCTEIAANPELAYTYTWKNNSVAVVSDGSAVLGLWNIGGLAGLPVMEGKAILFKAFGDVDAIPIVTENQDPEEIINLVKNIAPTFGGINLEDIKTPNCFYIEEKLKEDLDIPIFHDDQHGTTIVALAGLINALKITQKNISDIKIVVSGAGAAGIACAKLFAHYGAENIIMFDSKGSIHPNRTDLNKYKTSMLPLNKNNEQGTLAETLKGADVFVGVSQPNIISAQDVQHMNDQAIVFAMSNPSPEITPEEAKKWGAYIIATGRSDYPNQINNVLAFPGLFRGVLDAKIKKITDDHKIAAAEAIANYISSPTPELIIPSALDKNIANIVAEAVKSIGTRK